MSEQIKRVNRELKFKGTIIDFYQAQRSCGSSSGH